MAQLAVLYRDRSQLPMLSLQDWPVVDMTTVAVMAATIVCACVAMDVALASPSWLEALASLEIDCSVKMAADRTAMALAVLYGLALAVADRTGPQAILQPDWTYYHAVVVVGDIACRANTPVVDPSTSSQTENSPIL